ncbi:hypothetical protein ACOP1M_00150 [Staphylococcus warneri]|uniref:hypothetical protein n=1 Tax=Staphylococcus warneri TaxID=1292 RepID=UPI000D8BCE17|nr:hypothetical protein [Staphylococcus warneri]MCI2770662.1 hypothetical protein [Staphylococcus warneri]MCI2783381.1 hypothetical protein [Staphylococcus warneri]PXX85686.1 hypothetical protein DLY76_06585 [Staphylococcus warneri]
MTIREYLFSANQLLNQNTGNLNHDNYTDSAGKYQLRQVIQLIQDGYLLDDEINFKEEYENAKS